MAKPVKYYSSPRWSAEILDCSIPMTFDTYSKCSFNCLYCFSFFQKSHVLGEGGTFTGKHDYQKNEVAWVNVEKVKQTFLLTRKTNQFKDYVKAKKVIQWGGLADQFDNFEKQHGITLELMQFFKELNYPISYSTKAVWWLKDDRYVSLFRGQDNWNCKFSIINLDPGRSKKIEIGCPSPQERLEAIRTYSQLNKGGATLRLRPFIIGLSNRDDEYLELIKLAYKAGSRAVSTEFFCLEARADERLKKRYDAMSEVMGFDVLDYYKKKSVTSGYQRLTRETKRPYVEKMYDLCQKLGMRFYVSDAHFKEMSHNCCCCGLPESWNYSRGHFAHALLIAKEKGKVRFKDIQPEVERLHSGYMWHNADGFNTNSTEARVKHTNRNMASYIRYHWNTPNSGKSPYKYFGGILYPVSVDKDGNIVYEYRGKRSK